MKFLLLYQFIPLLFCSVAHAEMVVRMELQQGVNAKNIDIKLFESAAPNTVNSFLKYADAVPAANAPNTPTGSYTNSFIHFITAPAVSGGKFSYTPPPTGGAFICGNGIDPCTRSTEDFQGGLQRITTSDPLLQKEVLKPHIRGMIAMDVDGALSTPSSWHINLQDNNIGFLKGVFTVFGEVINNSMSVVDSIYPDVDTTLIDRTDIHSDFSLLPLVGYTLNNPVADNNLIKINSVKKLFSISSTLPASISSDTDFNIESISSNNQALITIINLGASDLNINTIAASDVLDPPFFILAIEDNCSGVTLTQSSSCSFVVKVDSAVAGNFTDTFSIDFTFANGIGLKNQPLNYIYTVSVGFTDTDSDGISDANEQAAPNGGDNDLDGTNDSIQANVASFIGKINEYVTLVVDSSFSLSNVSIVPAGQLVDLPPDSNVVLKHGIFQYEIAVPQSAIVEVGVVLPVGISPLSYYMFGETEANPNPHWYSYPVVQLFNNSTITSSTGEKFVRNLMKLTVQDGGLGDTDKVVNGKILIAPGAPAYSLNGATDSSGYLNAIFLKLFLAVFMILRFCFRKNGKTSVSLI